MISLLARMLKLAGLASIFIGILFTWQRINPNRLSFDIANTSFKENTNHESTPVKVTIDSLSIDAPIYKATISSNKWSVTDKGVSYLSSSPLPGKVGNSILYGHNWKNILGPLTQIRPGYDITITFSDGSEKKFEVDSTQVVNPSQSSVLANTDDTRLTIYTCTGLFDQKRFVVTAFPKEKDNS